MTILSDEGIEHDIGCSGFMVVSHRTYRVRRSAFLPLRRFRWFDYSPSATLTITCVDTRIRLLVVWRSAVGRSLWGSGRGVSFD